MKITFPLQMSLLRTSHIEGWLEEGFSNFYEVMMSQRPDIKLKPHQLAGVLSPFSVEIDLRYGEMRKKQSVRAESHRLLRRGEIVRKGCVLCKEEAQMHHLAYHGPKCAEEVVWLCKKHHGVMHPKKHDAELEEEIGRGLFTAQEEGWDRGRIDRMIEEKSGIFAARVMMSAIF